MGGKCGMSHTAQSCLNRRAGTYTVAFSADGRAFVWGDLDGHVYIWVARQ